MRLGKLLLGVAALVVTATQSATPALAQSVMPPSQAARTGPPTEQGAVQSPVVRENILRDPATGQTVETTPTQIPWQGNITVETLEKPTVATPIVAGGTIEVYSGPGDSAVSFGTVDASEVVVYHIAEDRAYVYIPATGNYAWVDATLIATGPVVPTATITNNVAESVLSRNGEMVATEVSTMSWQGNIAVRELEEPVTVVAADGGPVEFFSGPNASAVSFGPQDISTLVVFYVSGDRAYVHNPSTGNYGWVNASSVARGP